MTAYLFLQIVRSALKYLPSLTCAALTQVLASFTMPAVRFLPHARAYLRAVRRTNLYSSSIYAEKIYKPLLRSLGLDDDQALERAARCSHQLPDHFEN
jgi:hypothetical protein